MVAGMGIPKSMKNFKPVQGAVEIVDPVRFLAEEACRADECDAAQRFAEAALKIAQAYNLTYGPDWKPNAPYPKSRGI